MREAWCRAGGRIGRRAAHLRKTTVEVVEAIAAAESPVAVGRSEADAGGRSGKGTTSLRVLIEPRVHG